MNILNNKTKKLTLAFLLIIVVAYAGYMLYANYISETGRRAREVREEYRQVEQNLADLEEMQRNDTYGGRTPQETLDLFISALEAEDVELASKYFWLNERQEEWREGLQTAKDEGRLPEIVDSLKIVKPLLEERAYEHDYKFVAYNSTGEQIVFVNMEFNEFSAVWKIQSL